MRCVHCATEPMKSKLRHFVRLDIKYPVCASCNRAQRRPPLLKAAGRGKHAAKRATLRKALSIALAKPKFRILVFGPAPGSGSPADTKRHQIRDELLKMGHDAFFAEDVTEAGVPLNFLELMQLRTVADLVINVAASPGSQAEFEDFALRFEGRRQLAFLDERGRAGYAGQGTLRGFRVNGGIDEFFSQSDLDSCVLTLMAVDWVVENSYFQAEQDMQAELAKERSLI